MQRSHLTLLMQALRQHNALLACAVGAMAGASTFYGLPMDVPGWYALFALGVGLILLRFSRELGLFCLVAGLFFGLSAWQIEGTRNEERGSEEISAIWREAARKPHWVVGRLQDVVPNAKKPNRSTLTLTEVRFYQLPGFESVKQVRVSVFSNQARALAVGEGVAVPMIVLPPEGPRSPGERDYRLWRYLQPKDVFGYAQGTAERTYLPPAKVPPLERIQGSVEGMREDIKQVALPFANGVVSALLMGDQRAIPPDIREAYRLTGLTHLLAISGMQLTLVGGGLFFALRWLMALFPTIALRVNTKFWSALAGIAAAGFYTLLAGASVGVVRAFIMVALLMLAAMIGRLSVALRAWCVAAIGILVINPVMVMNAGFQLSMAAVLALLLWGMSAERGGGMKGALKELMLASIVAGAATAPLVLLNFGQLSGVGLVANAVAVPLMAISTYIGMLALLLWPLGLQEPLLAAMGKVVEVVNVWAVELSAWQGSVAVDAHWWPLMAVVAVATVAVVVLRIWWAIAIAVAVNGLLAFGLAALRPAPEVLVLDDGKAGLVRVEGAYKLVWAENVTSALWLADKAHIKVEPADNVPSTVDEALMPVTKHSHFAWAARYDTHGGPRWQVEPVRCGRIWQRLDTLCWTQD